MDGSIMKIHRIAHDLVLFFSVFIFFVLLNTVIFYQSVDNKKEWMLNSTNPNVINIVISNYVHIDFDHYCQNMLSFFILVIVLLLVNAKKIEELSLWVLLLSSITAWMVSALILGLGLIPIYLPMNGFSIATSALFGYVLFALSDRISNISNNKFGYSTTLLILGLISSIWFYINSLLLFSIICIIPLIIYIILYKQKVFAFIQGLERLAQDSHKKCFINFTLKIREPLIIIFSSTLLLYFPFTIPLNPQQGESIIATHGHLLGFLSGALLPIVFYERKIFSRFPKLILRRHPDSAQRKQ